MLGKFICGRMVLLISALMQRGAAQW